MHNKQAKNINFKIIAICSAAALVIAAVAVALFLIFLKKNPIPTDSSYLSSISSATSEIILSEEPEVFIPKLVISSPQKTSFTTTSSSFLLSGNSDPTIPLTLNGKEVTRDENGIFAIDLSLSVGKNTFTLVHGDEIKTFTVTYRYVVINSVLPATTQKYISNTTFGVSLTARIGSSATATFNGQTITLTESPAEEGAEFTQFKGSFTMPNNEQNTNDLNLGKIKFTATHNGVTESANSGDIICKKSQYITESDPTVPKSGNYIDVGAGVIG